jgi:hypothetical protein
MKHRDARRAAAPGVLELGRRTSRHGTERGQRLGDRQERHVRVAQVRAAAEQHEGSGIVRMGGELGQQARLAHAGLAADEHCRCAAAGGSLEGRPHLGKLALAARDDLAREPASHQRSLAAH